MRAGGAREAGFWVVADDEALKSVKLACRISDTQHLISVVGRKTVLDIQAVTRLPVIFVTDFAFTVAGVVCSETCGLLTVSDSGL